MVQYLPLRVDQFGASTSPSPSIRQFDCHDLPLGWGIWILSGWDGEFKSEVSSLLRRINTFTIKSGICVGHLNAILALIWGREFEETNLQNFKCPRGGGRVDASNWSAYNTGFILGHLWINLVLDLMILKNQPFIYRHYSNYKEKWGKPNAVTLPGDSLCL